MILKMTHIWYVHVHLLALDAGAHIKTNPTLAQNKSPGTSDPQSYGVASMEAAD